MTLPTLRVPPPLPAANHISQSLLLTYCETLLHLWATVVVCVGSHLESHEVSPQMWSRENLITSLKSKFDLCKLKKWKCFVQMHFHFVFELLVNWIWFVQTEKVKVFCANAFSIRFVWSEFDLCEWKSEFDLCKVKKWKCFVQMYSHFVFVLNWI